METSLKEPQKTAKKEELLSWCHQSCPEGMVEVCLVLAPDVNFFLNSRKQGLPC